MLDKILDNYELIFVIVFAFVSLFFTMRRLRKRANESQGDSPNG